MEDLVGGLLLALLFGALVMCALALAAAVLVATAIVCSAWALSVGVYSFSGAFAPAVAQRGGPRRAPRTPEPAFELYVLGQVFGDFRHSLEHAASALADVRGKIASQVSRWQEGATLPIAIGAIVGGYVGTGIAAAVGVAAGAVVGLVAVVASVASWLLIWLLRAADEIRRRVRHASYECPADHERFSLPVYVCPACGAKHARLVPGRWGVLKRECECGKTALPTTVIGGRQRVPQQCPSGHFMSGFLGYAENLPIAIVGGPSSGKSTFLAGALLELERPDSGVSLEPLKESRDAYGRLIDGMRAGEPPKKTTETRPPALVAEVQGSGRSRALYAYDVAGEVYGATDNVRGLRFLARSAGIALLIDPFSIPRVASEKAEQIAAHGDRILPSDEQPDDVLARLVGTLHEAGVDLQKMPLAVIVAKADACGIEREIDDLVVEGDRGAGVSAWLEANGAGNLVRSIEQQFKQIGWFSVSALGRMPDPADETPFVPRGAVDPMLWILACRDVRPSSDGSEVSHTAEQLVGSESDFPVPSQAARNWRALAGALAATILILAPAVALAAGGGRATAESRLLSARGSGLTAESEVDSSSSPSESGSEGSSESEESSHSSSSGYPLLGDTSVVVRSGPSPYAASVGDVKAGESVVVVCTSSGPSVEGTTLWDRIESPSGFVSDSAIDTGTTHPVAEACAGAEKGTVPAVSAPVEAIEAHYRLLNAGNYEAAFGMFTPEYRAKNPSWPEDRRVADPMIDVVRVGAPQINGGEASVGIVFYARDRNPSPGSDTTCRRFSGAARMVKMSAGWRFDPPASSYVATETPGSPQCHP